MERCRNKSGTRTRNKARWVLVGAAVLLVAALVPLPAAATHLGPTCGGPWSAPGASCGFDHVRDPVWFWGMAVPQNNTTGAHVEVRVIEPITGTVYGQCSATAAKAAFCGGAAEVPDWVDHLRCEVEGFDHGWYSCGTDP